MGSKPRAMIMMMLAIAFMAIAFTQGRNAFVGIGAMFLVLAIGMIAKDRNQKQ